MRFARLSLLCAALTGGGVFALAWTYGQERPPTPPSPIQQTAAAAPAEPSRDLSKLTPLQNDLYLSAQRGAEWLYRANRVDGRFVYGYVPALKVELEGDHYLRQVGAAFALARAGRYTNNPRHLARATQAILTLLGDTVVDAREPQVRSTALPSVVVNRLGAAGLLVLAINELPAPQRDLLDQSEQLCNFIRKQQRPDGSLCHTDDRDDKGDGDEAAGVYPGMALYALMRSQQHRPAAWKTEVVTKARPYYQTWWRGHKSVAPVPWLTAACTEAFLQTKDPALAGCVCEMSDWLCGLQYARIDPQHPLWAGGFMSFADGKPQPVTPHAGSAACAEALAEACRVARETADLPRHQRYSEAVERALQFLTTLQYTEGNTSHFAAWYRSKLVGAFHFSEQDGNLRIDYTQHAVSGMVQYLTHVARVP